MKNKKNIVLFVLSVILVFSFINTSIAYTDKPYLFYDGNDKSFSYFNTSSNDFFNSFKELMPGDKKTEDLYIKTDNIKEKTNMYIKILSSFNNSDILNKLNIKLYKEEKIIFDSSKNNYDEAISLHELYNDDEFKLLLEIEVPKEVGNEIKDLKYDLNLVFLIETEDGLIEVPKTYDNSNIIFNFIVMTLSFIIIVILLFYKKKNKEGCYEDAL